MPLFHEVQLQYSTVLRVCQRFSALISEPILLVGKIHKTGAIIMYEIFEALLAERGVTAYQVAKATGISTGSLSDL